jgi:hypothetical protein
MSRPSVTPQAEGTATPVSEMLIAARDTNDTKSPPDDIRRIRTGVMVALPQTR